MGGINGNYSRRRLLSEELVQGVALEGNLKAKRCVLSLELQIEGQPGSSQGRDEVWRR